MRVKKKGYLLTAMLCGMLSFSACSQSDSSVIETPYYSVTIDGVKQYRAESDEDVKKLIELGLGYVDLTCNINYKSTERAMEELDYYNKSTRQEYEEYEYIQSGVESFKYYEQVQEILDSYVTEILFFEFNGVKNAWVYCDYISSITHATDEYLEYMEVKLNTKYIRTMPIRFEMEDGEWKISDYDITDRVEVQ